MERLLSYLKEKDIIRKYQIIFDKYFNYDLLNLVNKDEINELISSNEYEAVIKLYEIVNSKKINEDIKLHILSLESPLKIKYSLRLAISNAFNSDEDKTQYISALCESNEDVVRYAYQIANSNLYINSIDGINCVKMVGKCNEEVLLQVLDILHSPKYREDEEFNDFLSLIKDCKEDYIAKYMGDLFKNEDNDLKRVPMSSISILLCSKGSKQAYYAYKILSDEKIRNKGNIDVIALLIAMCDDERIAKNTYEIVLDEINLYEDYPSNKVYDIMCVPKVKVKR